MHNYLFIIFLLFFVLPVSTRAVSLVNINTADATQLDTLPGIGPSKATAIIDYRTAHGLFTRIEDIQNVKGIGPSTYAGFKSLITIDTITLAQPSPLPQSTSKKQTVETAPVIKQNPPTHAVEAVGAPRAAALGAPVSDSPPVPVQRDSPGARVSGILGSRWTVICLGIVALAGGVLMIL